MLLPDNPCRRTLSEISRDLGTGSLDIISAQLNLIFALLFVTKCPVSTLINKDIVAWDTILIYLWVLKTNHLSLKTYLVISSSSRLCTLVRSSWWGFRVSLFFNLYFEVFLEFYHSLAEDIFTGAVFSYKIVIFVATVLGLGSKKRRYRERNTYVGRNWRHGRPLYRSFVFSILS